MICIIHEILIGEGIQNEMSGACSTSGG